MPKNAEASLASIVDNGFYCILMSRLLETPTYCILSWYSPATKGTKHAE